jgi:predicted nucleic acid-binding protein
MKNSIVIDSNIFIKIFKEEPDSSQAKELLTYVLENNISIVAPQLMITETIDVCLYNKVATASTLYDFFETLIDESILTPALTKEVLKIACDMTHYGHEKSGYPTINDCLYHAYALDMGIAFITADGRHKKKTEKYGHIVLLSNWDSIFTSH